MASIYKRTRRKPIPKAAEIVERRGKRLAIWQSRGRRKRAELTPDEKAVVIEDTSYTVEWFDWTGKRRRTSGGPDKDAAEALGRKLETEEMQRRRGLIDPKAERFAIEGRRPIQEHLANFRASLEARGNTKDHVDVTLNRVTRVVELQHLERIGDLTPGGVEAAITRLRDEGLSLRTLNGYLWAAKTFSRWLHRDGRVSCDAVAHLGSYNAQTDRRRERRALMPDEFLLLVEAAEAAPPIETISGPGRAMMYILSAWTGFRRRELSSLTLRSFDFQANPATVTVTAAYAKNRRADTQPLHPTVLVRLQYWLAGKGEIDPDARLFALQTQGRCWRKTVKMMRLDLERAGLPYVDEGGLYADFHAHRHTFISNLSKVAVPLAMAQKLARHSDPKLTANTYTHLGVFDKAAAIAKLPSLPHPTDEAATGQQLLAATGTDNLQPVSTYSHGKGQHLGQHSDGETWQKVASPGDCRRKGE